LKDAVCPPLRFKMAGTGVHSSNETNHNLERLAIRERGFVDISSGVFATLADSDVFWNAVERGILKISRRSASGARLHGSCFVGRLKCGNLELELKEKTPGALENLLCYASFGAFRVENLPALRSDLGPMIRLLVNSYVSLVTKYVESGRQFRYRSTPDRGSLVGGKLDVGGSIKLRARGLGHIVAFLRNELTFETELNQLVLATLLEIEKISRLVTIESTDSMHARGLSMLFSDCGAREVLFGCREELSLRADRMSNLELIDPVHRDIAALSSVILAHGSIDHSGAVSTVAPRSWFLNLESLFEKAVRRVLAGRIGERYQVTSASVIGTRPIFQKEKRELRANPDLVVSHREVVAIGDVKYKDLNNSGVHSDIYQLLAHAAAFKCNKCFLVFPGSTMKIRKLGISATGAAAWIFEVPLDDLETSLTTAAEHFLGESFTNSN